MAIVSTVAGVDIMRRRGLVMRVCRMLVDDPSAAMALMNVHCNGLRLIA